MSRILFERETDLIHSSAAICGVGCSSFDRIGTAMDAKLDWVLVKYQVAIDDIARTKQSQFSNAYYAGLVNGSLFLLMDYFERAELNIAAFYIVAAATSAVTATICIYLQVYLWASLKRFRKRVGQVQELFEPEDLSVGGGTFMSEQRKLLRDLPITVFLLLVPVGATMFLIWYVVGRL